MYVKYTLHHLSPNKNIESICSAILQVIKNARIALIFL